MITFDDLDFELIQRARARETAATVIEMTLEDWVTLRLAAGLSAPAFVEVFDQGDPLTVNGKPPTYRGVPIRIVSTPGETRLRPVE